MKITQKRARMTRVRKMAMKKRERQKRPKMKKAEKMTKRTKAWSMNLVPEETARLTSKVEKMRAEDGLDD